VTTFHRTTAMATVAIVAALAACDRKDRQTPESLRGEIAALVTERDALRARINALMAKEPRLAGMPDAPVIVGVPTTVAADLIQRVVTGFVDQVTLTLKEIKVRKRGSVKKVVTLGEYDLRVTINQVTGKLKTGIPSVTFGANRVALAVPVSVASGAGRATINFMWDGRNVGGAVCGDMAVTQVVSGSVRPATYPLAGTLVFAVTANTIVAKPKLPRMIVNLKVAPSEASWDAAQKVLDDKGGVCGFVLDRVDVMALVKNIVDQGFNVRLPTDRLTAMAIPVGVEPAMRVRGQPVALAIRIGDLVIGEQMIWLGAEVSVAATSTRLR